MSGGGAISNTRGASTVLRRAVPAVVAALLAGQAFVLGRSLWSVAAVGATVIVITGAARLLCSATRDRRDLHTTLALELAVVPAAVAITGFTVTAAVACLLVGLANIVAWGSRASRPAIAWSTMAMAASQLLVASGIAPMLQSSSGERELGLLAGLSVGLAIALVGSAVADRELAEEHLAHRAYHDELTHLPNRSAFVELLERAVARASRHGQGVALLFIDLDGFKIVNDRLGHHAGDELLAVVADRLRDCVRTEEPIGRMGGDEFAILLEDLGSAGDAVRVAERATRAIAGAIVVAGEAVAVRASVGIAISRDGRSGAPDLMREADDAMYLAKARRSGWEVFGEGTEAALALARQPHGAPMRVVLADDTASIRQLIALNLELDRRFEVVGEAANGADAVALVEALAPDAVVLDVAMPVMDGLQAIPLIRRASPSTKVVVLSGFGAARIEDEARDAGADAYVEKGVSATELSATLAYLCGLEPAPAAPDQPVPVRARLGRASVQPLAAGHAAWLASELDAPLGVVQDVALAITAAMDRLAAPGSDREADTRRGHALEQLVRTVVRSGADVDVAHDLVIDAR
jgi:diguanylate cyclase (GGDEF)-like protein